MKLFCSLVVASLAVSPAFGQCGVVADLTPGNTNNNNIDHLACAFGEELYFTYYSAVSGSELWRWDATNGAQMVVDYAPGSYNHSPEHMTACCTALGPRVFYSGFEIGHGHELFVTDGTAAGTHRVKEIRSGSSSSLPHDFVVFDQKVVFSADDGTGQEPWISDGTAAGTFRLADIWPGFGSSNPVDFTQLGDVVLFMARDLTNGRELWRTDGTVAGTQLLLDINPGSSDSWPSELTRVGDYVFFACNDGTHGAEIWRTDGTAAGTQLVEDMFSLTSVGPVDLCACNGRLFFREWYASSGGDLYVTDGVPGSTVNLSAATGVYGRSLTCSGDRVFFAGNDQIIGQELWVTDGTVAGTQLVLDIVPVGSSSPAKFVACGEGVVFLATTTVTGEVWYSDGTAAGTSLLCALDPGGNANPEDLTLCRGRVFMNAYMPAFGRELIGIETPGATTTQLGGAGGPARPGLATVDGAVPVLGSTVTLTGEGPAGSLGVLLVSGAGLPSPSPTIPGLVEGGLDWVGLQAGAALSYAVVAPGFMESWTVPANPVYEGELLRFQVLWLQSVAPTFMLSDGLQLVVGTAGAH